MYRPAAKIDECIQCGACVDYCTEEAISLVSGELKIDYQKCVRCGGCVKECPVNALTTGQKCYKVVVGGCGSRHPQLAATVTECTDVQGVLLILERIIKRYQDIPDEGRKISFHQFIRRHGIERLKI